MSLQSSKFPQQFRNALVTPLLKKPTLDPENLKNFRPVSNLSFISKVIEKVVYSQITYHLIEHNLHEPLQSAYRKHHGTETALLRVNTDILRAVDNKRGVFLVLLDLSAAFDTIDYDILFHRLQFIGVTGPALQWIRSYICNRTQSVNINGILWSPISLSSGVPQGSVLGPLFFTIYSEPIAAIVRRHQLQVHCYADDTQIYGSFHLGNQDDEHSVRRRIEQCVCDLKQWMTRNKLRFNDDKTELLIITSKRSQDKIRCNQMQIGTSNIEPSTIARNLGIMFDRTMSMESHVKKVCQTSYYHIRNINNIRRILTDESAAILIHALVTSRLDNGNSLLFGITNTLMCKLQRVQNTAARVLSRTRKFEHITPVLRNLHWLPVKQRVAFKIMLITWKALNDSAPTYLQDLLTQYSPHRHLRSSDKHLLVTPRTRTLYGDQAFSVSAPTLWNSLPQEIRSCQSLQTFKCLLKTFMFNSTYN